MLFNIVIPEKYLFYMVFVFQTDFAGTTVQLSSQLFHKAILQRTAENVHKNL